MSYIYAIILHDGFGSNCSSAAYREALPDYKDMYDTFTMELLRRWFRLPNPTYWTNETCQEISPLDTFCLEEYKEKRNNPNNTLFCGQNAMYSCEPFNTVLYEDPDAMILKDYNSFKTELQECITQFDSQRLVVETYDTCQTLFEEMNHIPSFYCNNWILHDKTRWLTTGFVLFFALLCFMLSIGSAHKIPKMKKKPSLSDILTEPDKLSHDYETFIQATNPPSQINLLEKSPEEAEKILQNGIVELNRKTEAVRLTQRRSAFLQLWALNRNLLANKTSCLPELPDSVWGKIAFFAEITPKRPFDDTHPRPTLKRAN